MFIFSVRALNPSIAESRSRYTFSTIAAFECFRRTFDGATGATVQGAFFVATIATIGPAVTNEIPTDAMAT